MPPDVIDHAAWFDSAPDPVDVAPVDGVVQADVIVVGLGASGLTACQYLAARGADVVGLDAVGIAAGAAGANGGFLLAGLALFHHDAVAALGRRAAAAAYSWTLDLLDEVFDAEPTSRRVGSLRLAVDHDEMADIDAHHEALHQDGFEAELHRGPEGQGMWVPSDGVVHPVARCRRLATDAIRAGARLHAPARVARVRSNGVELDDRTTIDARAVIVAVDGGLEQVVAPARLGRQVRTARLQMLATRPSLPVTHAVPEYRRWGRDYVHQLPTGEVMLGGGRDVGGADEWDAETVTTPPVQQHLDTELRRLGVSVSVTHRWAARAAFTADRLPVATTLDGSVHVVGGYSGHGNVLGPGLALRAAAAALDGQPFEPPPWRA